ncbi:hypothetical protein PMIN06_009458 [Paraphaeosphaeria minitans]
MSDSKRFMIAFGPPEHSQERTNEWEQYFKDSILPRFESVNWSQEKSGWGRLECADKSRVYEVLTAYGWKMGMNPWGSVRYDPVQQKPPQGNHQTKHLRVTKRNIKWGKPQQGAAVHSCRAGSSAASGSEEDSEDDELGSDADSDGPRLSRMARSQTQEDMLKAERELFTWTDK